MVLILKTYLPEFCDIRKIINSNKFKKKKNKFLFLLRNIFFYIKFLPYCFFFIYFANQINKLISFYKCVFGNYLIVPRYFKSFYLEYLKLNFNQNDNIFSKL